MSDNTADTSGDVEKSRAPLITHLIELRQRLMWCMVALAVAFVLCFYFATPIYNFLLWPYEQAVGDGQIIDMQFTAPHEFFFTKLKLALFGAFVITFPVLFAQIYMFVAPGLYKNERGAFIPYLVATPILFIIGASVVYFIVMPLAMDYFLSHQQSGESTGVRIQLVAKVSEYFSLITSLIFAFGVCFQLPIVLTLLARVGIVNSQMLKDKRRYALVGVFAVAAIMTPPDPFSQLGLAIPTYLLYETSIFMVTLVERKKAKKAAERDAE